MSFSTFTTDLAVRPDDIDMNNHVHASRYIDYVLAARYDQMARCYKMPMSEFLAMGVGWVIKTSFIEYKRPLFLGEIIEVQTGIVAVGKTEVKVGFEIRKKETGKISASGYFEYSLVSLETGRATAIPQEVIERYSV
jgi:YbgC/YbaW family acyl-CoA thioester hydrolase